MATRKPFGNRTSTEGKAANEKAAAKPAPAPAAPAKPSTRATPSPASSTAKAPATHAKTPTKVTADSAIAMAGTQIDPLQKGKENAQTFMGIIAGMPPETKERYLSAFTDFLSLPPDQQSVYLSGLEQQAKDIVAPKIEQDRTRMTEDFEYEKGKKEQEKRDLQATFDKIVGNMDFSRNRDIAKENETAAKVMQNVGNTSFVTGIAGSGIFSRRTAYVRENLQNNVDDVNINFNQKKGEMEQRKSQTEGSIDDEIARLYELNKRDLSDLEQTKKEDELGIFLDLAGNEFGQKGQQNAALLEAGVGGGTDDERKVRYNKEQNTLRLDQRRAREDQAVSRYKELYDIRTALSQAGRTAELSGIDAELGRLAPTVEVVLNEARNGYGDQEYQQNGYQARNFFGSSGSGIGTMSDWNDRWRMESTGSWSKKKPSDLAKYIEDNADTIRQYQSTK